MLSLIASAPHLKLQLGRDDATFAKMKGEIAAAASNQSTEGAGSLDRSLPTSRGLTPAQTAAAPAAAATATGPQVAAGTTVATTTTGPDGKEGTTVASRRSSAGMLSPSTTANDSAPVPSVVSEGSTAASSRQPDKSRQRKVKLKRNKEGGFGFQILADEVAPSSIFIAGLVPGGVAEASAQVFEGDRIMSINGKKSTALTHSKSEFIRREKNLFSDALWPPSPPLQVKLSSSFAKARRICPKR